MGIIPMITKAILILIGNLDVVLELIQWHVPPSKKTFPKTLTHAFEFKQTSII